MLTNLQTQFYVVLAIVPLSLGVYAASRPSATGQQRGFSNFIAQPTIHCSGYLSQL